MKVSYFPKIISKEKTVLILGGFESIHNGHLKLLEEAKKHSLPISMIIFNNFAFLPHHNKIVYSSIKIRLQQLANLGIDYLLIVNLSEKILMMNGYDFLSKLQKSLKYEILIAGKDFALGRDRHLKARDIKNLKVVEHVKNKGIKVSTTLLKELVILGSIDLIKTLAPFPYTVEFKITDSHYGQILNHQSPHSGIYATIIVFKNYCYYSLVHISLKKQVSYKVFNQQYKKFLGEKMFLEFHTKIRKIISSDEDYITKEDLKLAIHYFKSNFHKSSI